MPYFNVQLNGMTSLSFSTADDPFYKSAVGKFYPECVVLDRDGKELCRINHKNKKSEEFALTYLEDFRDKALKINDDRKI